MIYQDHDSDLDSWDSVVPERSNPKVLTQSGQIPRRATERGKMSPLSHDRNIIIVTQTLVKSQTTSLKSISPFPL